MHPIDLDFVRAQFPAFSEPSLAGHAFFENAGGSYVCRQAIDRLSEYYRRLKVQPYYPYPASLEAGEWMDAAHARLAEYLGVTADEVHFGPSTSQHTYVLAQALRKGLRAGDEIVVTEQDHEANAGVWRRLAADGIVVVEWHVDRDSGLLDPSTLERLLGGRTRLVAFPHCSNVVGHVNPVAEICRKAHQVGALTVVDGVSFAPHGLPDVAALGADVYLFSLYKTFGPHQGMMVVRAPALDRLGNEGHHFNAAYVHKRLVPAGPDHAQVAAARGVAEYLDAIDAHHAPSAAAEGRPERVRRLLHGAEQALLGPLLEHLARHPGFRLLGPADPAARAPTVSLLPRRRTPAELVPELAARGIAAGAGNFYAVRLLEAMGIDPRHGVLRLSFVHYTSPQDVSRLIEALDGV